jgi:hypothetical protein
LALRPFLKNVRPAALSYHIIMDVSAMLVSIAAPPVTPPPHVSVSDIHFSDDRPAAGIEPAMTTSAMIALWTQYG